MIRAVFDTGPIIGAFLKHDGRHQECAAFLTRFRGRRLLPVTVAAEVCNMLEAFPEEEARFLDAVAGGVFTLVQIKDGDIERVAELVRQYADFPLGGVDASVITIAERLKVSDVATLDHRHFRAVRPAHVDVFTLLP